MKPFNFSLISYTHTHYICIYIYVCASLPLQLTTTWTAGADWYFAILLAYKANRQLPLLISLPTLVPFSYLALSSKYPPLLHFKHFIIAILSQSYSPACTSLLSSLRIYKLIISLSLPPSVY